MQSSTHKDNVKLVETIGNLLSRLVNIDLMLCLESVNWNSSTLFPIRPTQIHAVPLKGDKCISENPSSMIFPLEKYQDCLIWARKLLCIWASSPPPNSIIAAWINKWRCMSYHLTCSPSLTNGKKCWQTSAQSHPVSCNTFSHKH